MLVRNSIPINIVLVVVLVLVLEIEGSKYGLEDDDEHEDKYESDNELNRYSTFYNGSKKVSFLDQTGCFLTGGGTREKLHI